MTTATCPTTPVPYDDDPSDTLAGCGSTNVSEPDGEGLVDCYDCGIWFPVAEGAGRQDA